MKECVRCGKEIDKADSIRFYYCKDCRKKIDEKSSRVFFNERRSRR